MKESQFGFEYSWSDMQAVRVLSRTVFTAQILGVILGFLFQRFPGEWFESVWFGAAVATFPAYLVGLVAQARCYPGSISANATMVRRLGLIALFLSTIAFAMPFFGVGK
jgi:hypothetical protein